MAKRNPAARYFSVRDAQTVPLNSIEADCWRAMRGAAASDAVIRALEIYLTPEENEVMRAWVFSRATDDDIEKWMRVPSPVTQAYRHLFMDLNVFRDELDVVSWVRSMENDEEISELGLALLRRCSMDGVDYLKWMYGRGEYVVDPQRAAERITTDAFFRGIGHRGAPIDGKMMTAYRAFLQMAMQGAASLGKKGAPNLSQVLLKLKHREMTTPLGEAAAQGEILH